MDTIKVKLGRNETFPLPAIPIAIIDGNDGVQSGVKVVLITADDDDPKVCLVDYSQYPAEFTGYWIDSDLGEFFFEALSASKYAYRLLSDQDLDKFWQELGPVQGGLLGTPGLFQALRDLPSIGTLLPTRQREKV